MYAYVHIIFSTIIWNEYRNKGYQIEFHACCFTGFTTICRQSPFEYEDFKITNLIFIVENVSQNYFAVKKEKYSKRFDTLISQL